MFSRYYFYILTLLVFYSPMVFANDWTLAGQINQIVEWLYMLLVHAIKWIFIFLTRIVFILSAFFFDVAIEVVKGLYEELGISKYVADTFRALPVEFQQGFLHFRIPDCINNILAGVWIRQMRAFIPFF